MAASEKNANALFGFGRTIYGTEGSSQCIRTMLFLALQERKNRTERPVILAARNAHKAFLYSCALLDVDVEWLFPEGAKSLWRLPYYGGAGSRRAEKIKCFSPFILPRRIIWEVPRISRELRRLAGRRVCRFW